MAVKEKISGFNSIFDGSALSNKMINILRELFNTVYVSGKKIDLSENGDYDEINDFVYLPFIEMCKSTFGNSYKYWINDMGLGKDLDDFADIIYSKVKTLKKNGMNVNWMILTDNERAAKQYANVVGHGIPIEQWELTDHSNETNKDWVISRTFHGDGSILVYKYVPDDKNETIPHDDESAITKHTLNLLKYLYSLDTGIPYVNVRNLFYENWLELSEELKVATQPWTENEIEEYYKNIKKSA